MNAMSSDPNKKSPRTFQCRDMLYETFEQMARELECSVDYLINEAMKQYARQRSYGQRNSVPNAAAYSSAAPPAMPPAPPSMRVSGPPSRASALPAPPPRGGLPAPPPPPRGLGASSMPPVRGASPSIRPAPLPPSGGRSVPPPIPSGRSMPPPITSGGFNGGPQAGSMGAASALSVMYQGERHGINKERFVIGRGKQSSDLTLKDPNVSRQHAMIEFQNGVYFMVDMGSTNGVEFNGQRIARKQIAEGDVFRICDHELRFTYR
jgi:hypothetical protein